jgi:hypothetical protein
LDFDPVRQTDVSRTENTHMGWPTESGICEGVKNRVF